jgi:hypothetical protein
MVTGDLPLDLVAAGRGEVRRLARALAEAGVPGEVILDDVRAGVAEAAAAHARSGR